MSPASKPTISPQAVSLGDALDMPPEIVPVQDAYWQARREWTELQNAYLTVIQHMVALHREKDDDSGF